jgi:chromosome segregation ATPase
MKEVKQLHEQYMGHKSQAHELKTRVQLYQQENEQAVKDCRDKKKECVRLTFQNDELVERVSFLEQRFQVAVQKGQLGQDDIDEVEKAIVNRSSYKTTNY